MGFSRVLVLCGVLPPVTPCFGTARALGHVLQLGLCLSSSPESVSTCRRGFCIASWWVLSPTASHHGQLCRAVSQWLPFFLDGHAACGCCLLRLSDGARHQRASFVPCASDQDSGTDPRNVPSGARRTRARARALPDAPPPRARASNTTQKPCTDRVWPGCRSLPPRHPATAPRQRPPTSRAETPSPHVRPPGLAPPPT